jgi:hypothetical protein
MAMDVLRAAKRDRMATITKASDLLSAPAAEKERRRLDGAISALHNRAGRLRNEHRNPRPKRPIVPTFSWKSKSV